MNATKEHAVVITGGVWELPVPGPVPAADALLIRPDGYDAWVGEIAQPELAAALTRWFASQQGTVH
jgi:3-(3-hydroxy-phenyl)propionate hydroxylase